MPRPQRRTKHRRSRRGPDLIKHLLEGFCLPCLIDVSDHDETDLREAWEELKGSLLPEYASKFPGTRPWAFWEYDVAGQRRERIDGGAHPFDNRARSLHIAKSDNRRYWEQAYKLRGGLPVCLIPPFDTGIKTESFEEEWSFLQRNG